jgi:hypothetical protein
MKPTDLKIGHVDQLNSETCCNPMFSACSLVVTAPKPWGAQVYVQAIGLVEQPVGLAYYRARREEMELIGAAEWICVSDVRE